MAVLKLETTKSGGVRALTILIDTIPVGLDAEGKGQATVAGSCGDGSVHRVSYSFGGSAGEKISVIVFCGASNVCEVKEAKVWPAGQPYAHGGKGFVI